jgi:mannose-6-phosphate isomerase-like protein (cupin superfamily)
VARAQGEGWAAADLDDMGEGPGFRKVRRELDVTAFGINAIVLPPGIWTGRHFHERQEETYFVHRGTMEFEFGDGEKLRLGPGGFVRVDAATVRRMGNVGEDELVYVIVGGEGGYVGRDGKAPEGETGRVASGPPGAAPAA